MKHSVLVSLLVIIITLIGCQSDTETIPKAKMFSIKVHTPKDVQAISYLLLMVLWSIIPIVLGK